jgi:hypothetical protein
LKTLVVAPTTNLEYAPDEVMSVVNLLGARLLQGKRATMPGLVDMLASGWDVVWFSTHGDAQGIWLSDGPANASELTTLIRATGAHLAVLNTCSSYEVARSIYKEVRCDFVCTVTELPDRMAFVTGTVFAQKIAEGFGAYDAYELAKPGDNTTYEFFQAREQLMPPNRGRDMDNGEAIERFEDLLNRLDAIVNGSPRYHIKGLVKSFEDVVTKLDDLTKDVAKLKDNQTFNRRLLLFLSVSCLALLVAVIVLIYFQNGNVR